MSDIKVSVVAPVYNTENYLKECLDSLINQTLPDIEIICINDGSKDSSLEILEEYSKNDSRIKIINQENQGVSVARNRGIKEAKGEYLTFVDSDDWLNLNALEIFYNTAQKRNTDVLIFSFYSWYSSEDIRKDLRLTEFSKKAENGTTFLNSYKDIFYSPMGTWGKLYRTSLIKENNISFPLNIQCGEDRSPYVKACICAKNISVIDEPFYYYRRNVNQSLTQGGLNTVSDMYKANQLTKKMIYNFENKKQMHCIFLDEYIKSVLWGWDISEGKSKRINDIKYLKYIKKECQEFKNYPDFPFETYKKLKNRIEKYDKLMIKKLFEPFFEIERREKRFVIYLFEHQLINISI